MKALLRPTGPIRDEHTVLLWQACAYAADISDAVEKGRRLTPAQGAMLAFLHYRLLPYITDEERHLTPDRLRDAHMVRLLRTDHQRLRADVENVESSRTRRLLVLAATTLVDRLDRHIRREEQWLADPFDEPSTTAVEDWALPLLFSEVIDLDALPVEHCDNLVRRRLAWLRPGQSVRLRASADLHRLWRRQHASHRNAYRWLYEKDGPDRWQVQVTRRSDEDCS